MKYRWHTEGIRVAKGAYRWHTEGIRVAKGGIQVAYRGHMGG